MEIKKTVSSIFMVPTLNIKKDCLKGNGFLNAYSKDGGREDQYQNCVYLLFHPDDTDKFREFLEVEYDRGIVIDDYDYAEGYVVVVYTLNPRFKRDFDLIRSGKYSKTSVEFQAEFPKTVNVEKNGYTKESASIQSKIFEKSIDLVEFWEDKLGVRFGEDQELWQEFNPDTETLNLEQVKKECKLLKT